MSNFKKSDRVIYIPTHAAGDRNHKDCEHGAVQRLITDHVFVIYDQNDIRMTTGDEPYTAAATRPEDLEHE